MTVRKHPVLSAAHIASALRQRGFEVGNVSEPSTYSDGLIALKGTNGHVQVGFGYANFVRENADGTLTWARPIERNIIATLVGQISHYGNTLFATDMDDDDEDIGG